LRGESLGRNITVRRGRAGKGEGKRWKVLVFPYIWVRRKRRKKKGAKGIYLAWKNGSNAALQREPHCAGSLNTTS